MDIIEIKPVTLWSAQGTTQADIITFLPSVYSFADGTLNVNYQLQTKVVTEIEGNPEPQITYTYVSGGAYLVPKDVVDEWSADNEIYDYVIIQLGLTKV